MPLRILLKLAIMLSSKLAMHISRKWFKDKQLLEILFLYELLDFYFGVMTVIILTSEVPKLAQNKYTENRCGHSKASSYWIKVCQRAVSTKTNIFGGQKTELTLLIISRVHSNTASNIWGISLVMWLWKMKIQNIESEIYLHRKICIWFQLLPLTIYSTTKEITIWFCKLEHMVTCMVSRDLISFDLTLWPAFMSLYWLMIFNTSIYVDTFLIAVRTGH